jgi:hypothetical protein
VQADAPGPGLAPLNFYANAATGHHMTTASAAGNAWAAANGFSLVAVQGYVFLTAAAAGPGAQPLEMWFSAARGDHFLVGTAQNRANAQGAGYALQYVDSYVGEQWIAWPNAPPTVPSAIPYPPSVDLVGFYYLNGANAVPPGIKADTWYPSWAANGKLYSSWTDGTVDGHRSGSGGGDKATTGFAVISGDDPFNLSLSGVDTYVESTKPYQGRYPSLNYYRDGVWYYGTYALENYGAWPTPAPDCGNWCIQGPFCSIRTSVDEGQTWTDARRNMTSYTDNLFGETAFNNSRVKFGAPHAVDFGQNAQHAPDGRLYIVGHGGESPLTHQSWMQGDSVYLARTVGAPDPATVNTPAAWEFYAGGAGAGATWDPAIANAKPIALWMTRGGVTTMSYHPALAKYIMVISTPTVSPSMVGPFDTYFLESDDMTGPWAYVAYIPQFGPEAYFVHMCVAGRARERQPPPPPPPPHTARARLQMDRPPAHRIVPPSLNAPPPLPPIPLNAQPHKVHGQRNRCARARRQQRLAQRGDGRAAARLYRAAFAGAAGGGGGAAGGRRGMVQFFSELLRVRFWRRAPFLSARLLIHPTPPHIRPRNRDFASGKPNPPGSGYHWSLLQSRFGVTAAFAEKLAQRKNA